MRGYLFQNKEPHGTLWGKCVKVDGGCDRPSVDSPRDDLDLRVVRRSFLCEKVLFKEDESNLKGVENGEGRSRSKVQEGRPFHQGRREREDPPWYGWWGNNGSGNTVSTDEFTDGGRGLRGSDTRDKFRRDIGMSRKSCSGPCVISEVGVKD